MKYKWSGFVVRYPAGNGKVILKNYLTGAVIMLTNNFLRAVNKWLEGKSTKIISQKIKGLLFEGNEIIVPVEKDEFVEYRKSFLDTRNNHAQLFSFYFLPTMQCQLRCSYCFENGVKRMGAMSSEILDQSIKWIAQYLKANPEVRSFRCILFGGEPMLEKGLITEALSMISSVVNAAGVKFWTEVITNGDLLDSDIAATLKKYDWRKVQITLDGPKNIHDGRRKGNNGYVSFDNIIKNVKMLLDGNYLERVNLRLSLDEETADSLPDLVRYLAKLGYGNRIHLSLGIVVPSLNTQTKSICENLIARKAIKVWRVIRDYGFELPDEFLLGPWCIAIAKHSAVLQPNGYLQKCFCTVGRPEFNFGEVFQIPETYTQDVRFEFFNRTDVCVKEKCPYLPVCGGGCVHDSVVKHGLTGFSKRLCQKELVKQINEGLTLLKYKK